MWMCARRWLRDGRRGLWGEPSRISSKEDEDFSGVDIGVGGLNESGSGLAVIILVGWEVGSTVVVVIAVGVALDEAVPDGAMDDPSAFTDRAREPP